MSIYQAGSNSVEDWRVWKVGYYGIGIWVPNSRVRVGGGTNDEGVAKLAERN